MNGNSGSMVFQGIDHPQGAIRLAYSVVILRSQPRYHSNDFFFEQVISRIFYTERGEEGGEEGAELQDQEESDSGVELQDEGEAVPQGQNVQEGEVFEFLKLPGRDIYFVFTTRPWTGEETIDWFLWDIVVPAVIKSKAEYWELRNIGGGSRAFFKHFAGRIPRECQCNQKKAEGTG